MFLLSLQIIFLLINLFIVSFQAATDQTCPSKEKEYDLNGFIKAGYLPDYRVDSINLNQAALHLTDIILFSIEPDENGSISNDVCCLNPNHYYQVRNAREYKLKKDGEILRSSLTKKNTVGDDEIVCETDLDAIQPLRILVSLGGAGRSSSFSNIVKSSTKRKRLITEIKQLCQREQLNGVDYDWEQPVSREDYQNYFQLIKETSNEFHRPDVNLMVTVAVHTHQILPEPIYNFLDRVHIMTYDIPFSKHDTKFKHHAGYGATVQSMKDFIAHGAPPEKISVGIPFYARHQNNPGDVKTFSEIVDSMKSSKKLDVSSHDSKQIENMRAIHDGFVFDSPKRITKKVEFAKEHGIGGIFFWEIGQDYQGEDFSIGGVLLQAASRAVSKFATNEKTKEL